jgi:AraC-like DNA-binding protein
LLAQAGEFYVLTLAVLEVLAPEFRIGARLRDEPGFLRAMIGRVGRAYLACDFRAGAETDGYSSALRLEGARPILASVVDCYLSQRDPPSALELARRFHVSPSQTRAVFKTVEAHGLVRLAGRGRLVDAEPLTEAYLGELCRTLAFFAQTAMEEPFNAFSADSGASRV